MIRDPSDGSVKEKPAVGITTTSGITPVIDTSTSGLPITKAKADYLARLAKSHEWLKEYRKAVDDTNRMNDKGEIPEGSEQ